MATNTTTKSQTIKEYFRSITIIHIALVFGLLLFCGVTFFLIDRGQNPETDQDLSSTLQLIIPIIAVAGVLASSILSRSKIKSIKSLNELNQKLQQYRSALILKFALLEAPAILCIVGYLLTANLFYLGFGLAIIFAMAIQFPTKEKAIKELELSPEEQQQMEDTDFIIT